MASEVPIISEGIAPLSGKISWNSVESITLKRNNTSYIFTVQTTRWFAFAESHLYKPWRIVMTQQGQWVGHVIAQFDRKAQAIHSLFEINTLFATAFEKAINNDLDLKHGDIISVPTKMLGGGLRHFGIYDQKHHEIIEYQPNPSGDKKGNIQATPFQEFCVRLRKEYKGDFDLRKHQYMKQQGVFEGTEVVRRARSQLNQGGYHVVYKNCEAFAVWCKTGKAQSVQSRRVNTTILDITLKAIAVFAVVVIICGVVFYVSTTGITTSPRPSASKALVVAIDPNAPSVAITGTTQCPSHLANGCKTTANTAGGGMAASGIVAAGVGNMLYQQTMNNQNTFRIEEPVNVAETILKEGWFLVQFGLNGLIQKRKVRVTETRLIILTKNKEIARIQWSKLVNIDDLNDKNHVHSFQVFFKDEVVPNVYIYCTSKSQKATWMKMFTKLCQIVVLTPELQAVKAYSMKLGFTENQIDSALTTYHQRHGTVYNVDVFIGTMIDNK